MLSKKVTGKLAAEKRLFVAALGKGLRVLQCFTPAQPELSVSELSRMTGMPQPTVWRLCFTLLKLGFLVSIPGRQTLRPGIPVLGLGHAVLADLSIGELARPDMQSIASRYEGAVSLGARDGLSIVYLQRCQGSAIVLADLKVGSRVPMATSATGWAYLAGLDAAERNLVLTQLSASLGRQWSDIEPKITTALRGYERRGFIVNKGSLHPRINSVAVPIRTPGSPIVLSVSSGGINEIFTSEVLDKVGEELKVLAMKLAPLLEYQPVS